MKKLHVITVSGGEEGGRSYYGRYLQHIQTEEITVQGRGYFKKPETIVKPVNSVKRIPGSEGFWIDGRKSFHNAIEETCKEINKKGVAGIALYHNMQSYLYYCPPIAVVVQEDLKDLVDVNDL